MVAAIQRLQINFKLENVATAQVPNQRSAHDTHSNHLVDWRTPEARRSNATIFPLTFTSVKDRSLIYGRHPNERHSVNLWSTEAWKHWNPFSTDAPPDLRLGREKCLSISHPLEGAHSLLSGWLRPWGQGEDNPAGIGILDWNTLGTSCGWTTTETSHVLVGEHHKVKT